MLISNLVGWALPVYLSFKAIKTPVPQDDIQWLTYWVVFGFFKFLESFALRIVLYLSWYFAFKTIFIVCRSLRGRYPSSAASCARGLLCAKLWLQLPTFRAHKRSTSCSSPFSPTSTRAVAHDRYRDRRRNNCSS
ncbi:TB2/DP1, HVA22 family-domain-containing protein [Mycena olivaceomarginata]|nr:TB2/DP1, HVA22 family-domain-containing protein [Mycena olivaceomarginata]